ncbi:UPF0496 4 [Olea europaea subsp. europaea]|uniref:UPF0496 4 n=1 Tax=Olea europaea subsp. europaea TaxID=158383 RepID=A0A8S0V3P1_OLEEU|nr:UPF0496 4 [Olea europaea subsp. europaea]
MCRVKSFGHIRSLSWSVSPSWSAAKKLQALGNNMVALRGNEVMATNGPNFPLTEENESEAGQRVKDLGKVSEAIKDGLDPLDRLVREVFNRIVCSRTEDLDSIG